MKLLTFIILTRNRSKYLKKCLDSILKFRKANYEFIVINNGSTDNTINILKKYKDLTLINNKKNLGVAIARNQGLALSKGKFIIFFDDDAYIQTDPFPKIISFMEKDRSVGILSPKIFYPNGLIQESVRSFPSPLALLWRGTYLQKLFPNQRFLAKYLLKYKLTDEAAEIDWAIGACLVIRKKVFEEIGLFDEKFFFGYEDADFCYRTRDAGWKVMYWPFGYIFHYYARESSKGIVSSLKMQHLLSILRFYFKRL